MLVAIESVAQLSVEWNFSDFTGTPERVRRVIIRPLASYGIWRTNIVSGDRLNLVTSSRGGIVVSNIYPGAYQVKLYGRTLVTTFTNYFPPEAVGLVNAADYLGVSPALPGDQYAYSAAASDARYMTNSAPAPAGGYVLALTDTDGNYAWTAISGNSDAITNNQNGLVLEGTFSGRYFGNGGGLTNVLSMSLSTNYSRITYTNFSQMILTGFGDPNANGTYTFTGLTDGKKYFSNGQYILGSSLSGGGQRWGLTSNGLVYYLSPRTNAYGYPASGTWVVVSGTPPGGTLDFVTTITNGNGFVAVNASFPVVNSDGNTAARVETYGSDITGRIGFTPVMPFASIDGVTVYLTSNPGSQSNNGVISVGAGLFRRSTVPLLSGQSIVGLGRGVSVISGPVPSLHVQNSNLLENLTFAYPVWNQAYGRGCTNLTLIDVDIGTPNATNVIDALFSTRGYLDGMYGVTAERCHFASSWDLTEGVVTGTFYDCRMDTIGGPFNYGSGLHPYTIQWENSFYIIHGGEANAINGPATTPGGLPANACVWIVATNANVRLFGPRLNHYGTNGIDYAVYNLYGNTNVIGWYWDNGVLMYVNGTNYWTNAPPSGWPPARLFDHY